MARWPIFHALWVVARPFSHVKNIALVGFAFILAGADIASLRFALAVAALSFFWSAFYIYNAMEDIEIDRVNPNKKHYAEAITLLRNKGPIAFGVFFVGAFSIAVSLGSAMLIVLGITGLVAFLYSSKRTRFKERRYLNFIFGGVFTYSLRFLTGWVVASTAFPPLLPLLALATAKSGGYLFYKEFDRKVLTGAQDTGSASALLWKGAAPPFFLISFLAFMGTVLNADIRFPYLGILPLRTLWLLPFAVLPLAVVLVVLRKNMPVSQRRLRTLGLVYFFFIAIVAWRLLV